MTTDDALDSMTEDDALEYCNEMLSTSGMRIVPVIGTGNGDIKRRYRIILEKGEHNRHYYSVKEAYYGAVALLM